MKASHLLRAACVLALGFGTGCVGGSGGKSESKEPTSEAKVESTEGESATRAGGPVSSLVVWDGDEKTSGKGWATCNKKGECQASLEAMPGVGKEGAGLKFHGEGPDWIGMGWNWHGWYPEDAGTDVSGHEKVSFWIKVEAKTPAEAPDPNSVEMWLSCSCTGNKNDEKGSNHVKLKDFNKDFNDGSWQEVVVPLKDLYEAKGAKFDKRTVWEFDIGTYSSEPRNFNIYVDKIAFL
jgi:hypothetical protein